MGSPNDIHDINALSLGPSSPANMHRLKVAITPLGSPGIGACGMWQVMAAMLNNITAIQNYDSQGLIPLSVQVENVNENNATFWLKIMSNPNPVDPYDPHSGPPVLDPKNSDQYNIQSIIAWLNLDPKNNAQEASVLMQEATTTFNTHNTLYSQANTFWSGINNGLNQSSSDTSQTIQVDLQMYSQGPGAQMQTLAQII